MKTYIAAFALSTVSVANASGISASYVVSGERGNYTLDFTFTNNSPVSSLDLYFLGVEARGTISGTPLDWGTYEGHEINSTYYNLDWLTYNHSDFIAAGKSQSGFLVQTVEVPISVKYFGYLYDFTGNHGNINGDGNPRFTGTASPVPEPLSIIAVALGSLALLRGRRPAKAA